MEKTLKADKMAWYEKFGLRIRTDARGAKMMEEKSVGIDEAGSHWNVPAHLTLSRDIWRYKFRPQNDTDTIFRRIFGRGSNGLHVTLETGEDQEPRCYVGGPNYGRDEDEKELLEEILAFYVARFEQTIRTIRERYAVFEFPDSDQPMERLLTDPADCFAEMGRLAGRAHDAEVVHPAQADSALLWACAALHPLQSLQNTHQRLVRDACRGLVDDAAKEKESEELGKYYYFRAASPKLMGQPKDAAPDVEEQLESVRTAIARSKREVRGFKPADAALHLRALLMQLVKLRSLFDDRNTPVPALEALDQYLQDLDRQIGQAEAGGSSEEFERILGRLERAQQELESALLGLCCIQNFHVIEPFYLFRLLVKFQIQSEGTIPAGLHTTVSSTATDLLHNSDRMAWLFKWLRNKLLELHQMLQDACPKGPESKDWPEGEPAVVFFLKGGRAAKYLQNKGEKGENDWDTNIVINPNLPAAAWYLNFLRVHNTVLEFLQRVKREFYVLAHQHADELWQALQAKRQKIEDSLEEVVGEAIDALFSDQDAAIDRQADQAQSFADADEVPEKEIKNCKAELIDIGIPRRDTVEAFEQWFHVCPQVKPVDEIPIPGHLYFIAEYGMMIREAFMNVSRSMDKIPKRVVRLLEVLEMRELRSIVEKEKKHIPAESLKESRNEIEKLQAPLNRVMTIFLKQFVEAYDLAEDPDLARCFNEAFKKNLPNRKAKVQYPESLTKAINDYKEHNKYEKKHEDLADVIGYAQSISEEGDKHFREERAKFIMEQRRVLANFVKAIYTASIFGAEEDLEVQFAITGAFAAHLHAEFAKFERMQDLEPVRRVDLKIYCQRGSEPAVVLELILPLIEKYINHPSTPDFELRKLGDGAVCLMWPKVVKFSETMEYKPMVVKVSVEPRGEDWPQLAFIKGLPVLSLRDLIWEYKRHAGLVEEAFTQRGLRTAIEALVDMLTLFENPNAGEP